MIYIDIDVDMDIGRDMEIETEIPYQGKVTVTRRPPMEPLA